MNQNLPPESLGQEQSSPIEETLSSPIPKNSFQLKIRFLLLACLVISVAGLGIGKFEPNKAQTQTETQSKIKPLPVQTTQVQLVKNYQTTHSYTGEVVPRRASEIGFERSGQLVKVFVDEGDRISKGTIIGQLDITNLAAQRQSLIAQKAQAQAKLAELKNGARSEQIAAAQARVNDLKQQLELERLKRERREYLYNEGAISKEQLEEIVFNYQALSERLNNARSNLEELLNGTRYEQVAAQKAVIGQLLAEIADLDVTIAKSTLKAPFSGTVAFRYFDEGTVIQSGNPIIRIVEDSRPEVKIGIPIDIAEKISSQTIQTVKIGGKIYPTRLKSILPEVDVATRTQTVILELESTAQVAAKQIARLEISQTIATEGYWLPVTALVKSDRGLWSSYAVVEVEQNDSNMLTQTKSYQVEPRLLEVLETKGDQVLVRGTIKTGDLIVTNGTQRLVPGQLVTKISDSLN